MRIYRCPFCAADLYFRNLICTCGQQVALDPATDQFVPLAAGCANRELIDCNWVAPEPGALCVSCDTTEVIPDLTPEGNTQLWADAEAAKRWVLIGLFRLGWFAPGAPRPEFRFLAEQTSSGETPVVMGHANGVVTINIAEADPVIRTRRREALDEDYRTLIGHMRHELAHFQHWVLEDTPAFVTAFRALFGDETEDYGAALERYYGDSAPPDWQSRFITAYASAHPHEDWAESVAHLLHLVDILDSAAAAGLSLADAGSPVPDPYRQEDSDALIAQAMAYALAINHINRSMGIADLYPFVVNAPAREKLAFVHDWIRLPHPARLLEDPA
ncbi:MAG: putative zinc-binding peptidase [Rhodobacteraceae bacterium]|nr:putative zinc-binding peptidase [Paracoccaceae bacterium]